MIKIDLKEAERHLDRLIEEATDGQEVVITSGRMVRLVPVSHEEARKSNESKATKTVGHALDHFMGTWTAEQEGEVLEAATLLGHMERRESSVLAAPQARRYRPSWGWGRLPGPPPSPGVRSVPSPAQALRGSGRCDRAATQFPDGLPLRARNTILRLKVAENR